jgi:glycosyltransferase involved in cell wall biosynthesis
LETINTRNSFKWNKKIFNFIKKSTRDFYIVSEVIKPLNHDFYHFHSIVKPNVKYLQYLPKNKKVICSFWGLDLYQRWGLNTYYYISLALNRSNIITVQSLEMKEVLLAKFGSYLREKVRVLTFPLEKKIFNKIDKHVNDFHKQIEFKKSIGIVDLKKTVITIGYNASANGRHIEVLHQLNTLTNSVKSKMIVVLPLTYGRDINYLKQLENCLLELTNIDVYKIESYMSWDDIALLKIISDITIQVPFNDALSSAILEVLYAKNIVLAGDWLPYRVYERNNINYEKADSINSLNINLKPILENIELYKERNKMNPEYIKKVFLSESIIQNWIDIYNELM